MVIHFNFFPYFQKNCGIIKLKFSVVWNLKITVCDDRESDRNRISEFVSRYAEKVMVDIEIDEYAGGEALLAAYQEWNYPIVFLDIFMEGLSGVATAYKIREKNADCMLIFTTESPDFMAAGFDLGATHYLLKPLTYKKVEEALNRCRRLFYENERYFCVMADRRTVQIRFRNVLYIEVYGKLVLIHTSDGVVKTYTPLGQIADMLSDGPFLQCHRCYIINMNYISGVLDDSFVLDNNETIPIRRKGRLELKDTYSRYFLNALRRR
jgi:two-component system, LytTR family, response regulator LytT